IHQSSTFPTKSAITNPVLHAKVFTHDEQQRITNYDSTPPLSSSNSDAPCHPWLFTSPLRIQPHHHHPTLPQPHRPIPQLPLKRIRAQHHRQNLLPPLQPAHQ